MDSAKEVAAEAARRAADTLAEVQKSQKLATFVLAGGRLPPMAYGILTDKYAKAFEWSNVAFLIGDERHAPLNDPDSSWLSASPMFEAHPEIPVKHKLRPPSNLSVEQAADEYTKTLLTLPRNQAGLPILHHLWLGMGEDGHTLSLFPNHPSSLQKTDRLVIPVHDSPKPPSDRISLSYAALAGVETAIAFISGSSKASIVASIASGDHDLPIVVASKIIENAGGHVVWLIDNDAASQLKPGQSLSMA